MIQGGVVDGRPRVVLHVSNTDISADSRILKELSSLSELGGVCIHAAGVPDSVSVSNADSGQFQYHRLNLRSRRLKWLPRAIRYCFELVEFTVKVVSYGRSLRPGLLHCHDTFALPSGWLLNRLLGCQLVYDAHELESNKNGQSVILSKATLMIEKLCWDRVDLMVSVSDSITDWYMRNLGPKRSILVLNSPVVIDMNIADHGNRASESYLREKFGIPAEHLVFVYVGILGGGRGIEICLQAFSAGPKSAHVVFVGFGDLGGLISGFAARNTNIHFHPAVPHNQVVSLVRSADYGLCLIENVSLSDYFCLPNKLFEYSFARLTVLASDFPEIGRVVRKYALGVCCDPTAENVTNTLNQLVGRRPVRPSSDLSELSWGTQASHLKAAYQDLLGLAR